MMYAIARRHSALYWCNEIIRGRFSQPEPLIGPYDLAAPSGPQWQQVVKDLQVCEFPLPVDVLVDRQPDRRVGITAKTWRIDHLPPRHTLSLLDTNLAVASPELSFLQAASALTTADFEGFIRLVDFGYELCGLYKPRVSRTWRQVDELFGEKRNPRLTPILGARVAEPELEQFEELCWESAFYGAVDYRTPVTTSEKLTAFLNSVHGVNGVKLARLASTFVLDRSASPMETQISMILTLPPRYGGAGFPTPKLNYQINLDEQGQRAARMPYYKVDLCWPEGHLIVEYDGGNEHGPEKETEDARRRMILESMGYTTLSVRKGQLNGPDIETLIKAVAVTLGDKRRSLKSIPDKRNSFLSLLKMLRTPIDTIGNGDD